MNFTAMISGTVFERSFELQNTEGFSLLNY